MPKPSRDKTAVKALNAQVKKLATELRERSRELNKLQAEFHKMDFYDDSASLTTYKWNFASDTTRKVGYVGKDLKYLNNATGMITGTIAMGTQESWGPPQGPLGAHGAAAGGGVVSTGPYDTNWDNQSLSHRFTFVTSPALGDDEGVKLVVYMHDNDPKWNQGCLRTIKMFPPEDDWRDDTAPRNQEQRFNPEGHSVFTGYFEPDEEDIEANGDSRTFRFSVRATIWKK